MKIINSIILIMSSSLLALVPAKVLGQNVPAQMTFHVIDDSSNRISGLGFGIGSWVSTAWNIKATETNSFGVTDGKGNVTLSVLTQNGVMGYGTKYGSTGYYGTHDDYQFKNTNGGKWQPWNPTLNVVVKPILNPIPMYAQEVCLPNGYYMTIPATNTPVGFDLEAGDWVAPYGKGSVSDFIFTMQIKTPYGRMTQPYDVIWTLSFSNKGDGVQSVLVPKNVGSAFRLPRLAPETGYQPTLVQEISYDGKQWKKGAVGEDQNYFFRVRTVQDDQGNIKSALYGKIAGPIECAQIGRILFTYYLNPTPNDQNMEFDPKKNLFKNLSDLQQVNAP